MKKKLGIVFLGGIIGLSLFSCCESVDKVENITISTPESAEMADFTVKQVKEYIKKEGLNVEVHISSVSERDAASYVISDVDLAPDIYTFSQNSLALLVQRSAIQSVPDGYARDVRKENDAQSVEAATIGGQLFAYPLSTNYGYVMYYDKSVITDPTDMTQIISDCKAKNKYISFNVRDPYYGFSYFSGAGAEISWETDNSGAFISHHDDYDTDLGVIACKGIKELINSEVLTLSDSPSEFVSALPSAAVITSIYNDPLVKDLLGSNYAVSELPYYTVDGNKYHLGSYHGNLLVGVKPQRSASRAVLVHKIAKYITGYACQKERLYHYYWLPTNKTVQLMDSRSLARNAYDDQLKFATKQFNTENSWNNIFSQVLVGLASETNNTEEAYKGLLDKYISSVSKVFDCKGYCLMGSWNEWNSKDFSKILIKNEDGEYYCILRNVKPGDNGLITKVNENETDKGFDQIVSGSEFVTKQASNAFGFIEAGNYKVIINMTNKEIKIEKL